MQLQKYHQNTIIVTIKNFIIKTFKEIENVKNEKWDKNKKK